MIVLCLKITIAILLSRLSRTIFNTQNTAEVFKFHAQQTILATKNASISYRKVQKLCS